jgi:hypothetical protein
MNHRYEANLPKLRRIYSARFPMLRFLIPFYGGNDPDVIRVFESSHFFQGFVAQASATLLDIPSDHYVFCADDMLLSPSLNAENIAQQLTVDKHDAYIQALEPLTNVPFTWPHAIPAIQTFSRPNGVEWTRELPSADDAFAIATSHGIRFGPFGVRQYSEFPWRPRHGLGMLRRVLKTWFQGVRMLPLVVSTRLGRGRGLPYPLVMSYSDFFAIRRERLGEFANLCGVLAAMGLFAEVAIPTALLLSCDSIVVESSTGDGPTPRKAWRGLALWDDKPEKLVAHYRGSLAGLISDWPEDRLYIHPVKLGQWKDDQDVS